MSRKPALQTQMIADAIVAALRESGGYITTTELADSCGTFVMTARETCNGRHDLPGSEHISCTLTGKWTSNNPDIRNRFPFAIHSVRRRPYYSEVYSILSRLARDGKVSKMKVYSAVVWALPEPTADSLEINWSLPHAEKLQ